ncbi:MAG: Ig-like domain-containing protein [Sulfuritalea sp.]|nr:Ig-like domain-containing protein [Sulfuritalea sp.]
MENSDARRCGVELAVLLAAGSVGAADFNSSLAPLIPNIQRAQAPVITTVNGIEYALVADYFFDFLDPGYYLDMLDGKQAGGKIGIVKDPFGKAEYLGATTPIIDANFSRLQVSDDGKALWADIRYWPTIDDAPPPSGMLVWKLDELIAAAEKNSLAKQNTWRPLPIDREGTQAVVTPTKFNLNEGPGITSGWMFGMARSQVLNIKAEAGFHFGDVGVIDLTKLIKGLDEYKNAKSVTGFSNSVTAEGAVIIRNTDTEKSVMSTKAKESGSATTAATEESYEKGTFSKDGVLFLVPTLTPDQMNDLREGKRLAPRSISINLGELTIVKADGSTVTKNVTVAVNVSDFASAEGRVFFGDRDLANPGYSEFKLSGTVGVEQTNNPLDVFRVEQRLKYLGFPAIGTGSGNTLKEFKTDGTFGDEEKAALKLFEKVVRYQNAGENSKFNNDASGADGALGKKETLTLNWLNAYNAPHWMQFFESTGKSEPQFLSSNSHLPGWNNSQLGTFDPDAKRVQNVELYGTSWMYDLMVAKQYSPNTLRQSGSLFNGSVDANYGVTPRWVPSGIHSSHDLGMAFDLGVSNHIGYAKQKATTEALSSAINSLPKGPWSVVNAIAYTQPVLASGESGLPNTVQPTKEKNDQVSALRDFLSLYAVTRGDAIKGNGTWDDLPVKNGETARAALFGSGQPVGGLISKVLIGDAAVVDKKTGKIKTPLNANPYANINAVLYRLGITASPADSHQNHFHIYLSPPALKEIATSKPLLADGLADSEVFFAMPEVVEPEVLLSQVSFMLNQGEELMFVMDVPYVPVQETSVVLAAETATADKGTLTVSYILKDCQPVPSMGDPKSAERVVDPASALSNYMENRVGHALDFAAFKNPTLIEGPKHGKMTREVDSKGDVAFGFDPTPEYVGSDVAVFTVDYQGRQYKVIFELKVRKVVDQNIEYCPKPTLIKVKKPAAGSADYGLGGISVGFSDLPASALGSTTNTKITLDDNAAGYNWYIDATPADNSEYLPTANPNEWIAKADSEAAGKMDMLSVLLHEYGHALGIEHSASAHDYMATTLAPGVRRLPSAEELALMSRLAGDLRLELAGDSTPSPDTPSSPLPSVPLGGSLGLALLGRLRGNRYGGWNVAVDSASLIPQYAVAANPKLSNTEFAGGQGWSTTGDVRFQDGAATLIETASSQTRLNQVFIVGENDRFLSFTVAETALDDADQAPDDAFEVALLDANTGASLLGGTGLTRNDAFLNLQADGNDHKSQAVTSIRNADGSRTYLVDLAGIPTGTAVNLAFDLIGFGKGAAAASSHLTIRDLRIGVPQTRDDSVTLAEDTPIVLDALANDLNARQPGFVPVIVDAPAHGQVTINADGSFSFAPEQNWNGEDRFTYKLSDGRVDSNLATVSLTVTPVNDAPVTVADAASVGEDGTLAASRNLLANDSDVDAATVLTVAAPGEYVGVYGTLTLAQDGSYSYTLANDSNVVQALCAGEVVTDVFAYAASDGLTSTPAQLTVTITGENDAPVTAADAANVQEDGTIAASGNLLANDSDADAGTVPTVFAPGDYVGAYGTLNLGLDGSYSYALTND